MMIEIDPSSPVPLYLQISDQLRRLIALGALRPGDRVPTVREIAVRSRVNRNTAARAIQHLESEALVRTRVGQGTFVADSNPRRERAGGETAIDGMVDRLIVEAHTLGLSPEAVERRIARRIAHFRRQRASLEERTAGSKEQR